MTDWQVGSKLRYVSVNGLSASEYPQVGDTTPFLGEKFVVTERREYLSEDGGTKLMLRIEPTTDG